MTDTPRTAEEILAALKALADQPRKKPLTTEEEVTLAQDLTGDLTMGYGQGYPEAYRCRPGRTAPGQGGADCVDQRDGNHVLL